MSYNNIYAIVKSALVAATLALFPIMAEGQDVTSSPYSRFGYGLLNTPVSTALKGMGGAAIGVQSDKIVNFANPAAYAASDSLSFIMDIGVSANWSRYGDGKVSKSAILGNLDYLAMQFSLYKDRLIFSTGIVPFSTAGYGLKNLIRIENSERPGEMFQQTFKGTGSIQSLYGGLGAKVFGGLSLGANVRYTFGAITHTSQTTPSSTLFNRTLKSSDIRVSALSFDFGAQYKLTYGDENYIVLGATFSPAAKMSPELTLVENKNAGAAIQPEIIKKELKPDTELPLKAGFGVSWNKGNKLLLASDVQMTRWGSVPNIFANDKLMLKDSYKVSLGAEYSKDRFSRDYADKIIYRGGVNYETSYTDLPIVGKVDRVGAALGIGLPVSPYNERTSYVNLSLEYIKGLPSGGNNVFSEDMVRLSLSINFSETWFKKLRIY
ncbi:hypothetical protein [Porphyromonas sp.]|uniref:hypothetical protein n=1 Tax=Porphyromonas sp. TaxID=1924944 RepID=UPI0026DB43CF|nr:hypothetical protein [Porphyromonas sp.]MDO4770617.1 hypothetical protein [Porphyromonas sp.]